MEVDVEIFELKKQVIDLQYRLEADQEKEEGKEGFYNSWFY